MYMFKYILYFINALDNLQFYSVLSCNFPLVFVYRISLWEQGNKMSLYVHCSECLNDKVMNMLQTLKDDKRLVVETKYSLLFFPLLFCKMLANNM